MKEITSVTEFNVIEKLEGSSNINEDYKLRRLRRKLILRRLQRTTSKPFDLDTLLKNLTKKTPSKPGTAPIQLPTELIPYHLRTPQVEQMILQRYNAIKDYNNIPYDNSILSRIYGSFFLNQSLTNPLGVHSAYSGKILKPYIWRDYESKPAMMQLLESIKKRNSEVEYEDNSSIDYVHFQGMHLEEVNELLAKGFWGGINVRESLSYPDFSIVALYKRQVIGCAFMMPEGYITYFMVRPGWRGAGIGRFMLFFLIQSMPVKDITLHVLANNPSMILYQEFGFKAEEFVVGFYEKYLTEVVSMDCECSYLYKDCTCEQGAKECICKKRHNACACKGDEKECRCKLRWKKSKHAFLLRLRRS